MASQKQSLLSFASILSVLSIVFYSAGFLRVELELNDQKKRMNDLENNEENLTKNTHVYGFLAIYLWGIETVKRLRGWAKWRELGIVINRLSTVPLTLLQLLPVSQKTPAVGTAGGVGLLRQTEFLSTCFR